MSRSYLHSKSIDYVMEISFKILRVVSQKYICFIATWAIFGVAYVNNYPSFIYQIYINTHKIWKFQKFYSASFWNRRSEIEPAGRKDR